jgi:hypothetical protein
LFIASCRFVIPFSNLKKLGLTCAKPFRVCIKESTSKKKNQFSKTLAALSAIASPLFVSREPLSFSLFSLETLGC